MSVVHSIPSNLKDFGSGFRWRYFGGVVWVTSRLLHSSEGECGGCVMSRKSVGTCNLPRISLACCIPFDIFLVGRAAVGGGKLLFGGIQLAIDVVMLPLFPQKTMRWLSLGSCTLQGDSSVGITGRRHGVVVRWVLGVLLGGFSLGWALLNPGL